MGYSHAVTGTAGWLAVTSTSGVALGIYDPGPGAAVLAGSILCAGAGMAPDADHADASIAHSLPPISSLAARGIGFLSGGHRHGTHSLIGVAAFTAVTYFLSLWITEIEGREVAFGSGVIAVFLVAFATKTFGLHRSIGSGTVGDILGTAIGPWIIALGTAGAVTYYLGEQWTWLPICVAIGAFIHVAGDGLTEQGVPWLWPWNPKPPAWVRHTPFLRSIWLPNGYFRLPLLGRTGGSEERSSRGWSQLLAPSRKRGRSATSWQETVFITIVSIYAIYLLAYEVLRLVGEHDMLF